MDDLRQRFGRLVAANRRRKGWTQQQLADTSGVSLDMIDSSAVSAVALRLVLSEIWRK